MTAQLAVMTCCYFTATPHNGVAGCTRSFPADALGTLLTVASLRHHALHADAYRHWQDHHPAVTDHQLPAGTPRGEHLAHSTVHATPAVLLVRGNGGTSRLSMPCFSRGVAIAWWRAQTSPAHSTLLSVGHMQVGKTFRLGSMKSWTHGTSGCLLALVRVCDQGVTCQHRLAS